MHRARVPAPFPVHRWADHLPDVVVLPGSTEEVAEVVRIANRFRIPVVPRSGGTGLTDGAVPLRHGILLDLKRLDAIHEIDLENRTCTVGAGINMLKLNERLGVHGLIYPDDPASYPCSLVGGRIGTSGWSLIGSRYGHTRDLVLSFVHVLPTGDVVRFGDGGGAKVSKSSTGYTLKPLFMGHQGTLGVATEATLKLYPKPEAELSPFWAFEDYDTAYRAVRELVRTDCATFAGAVLFDEHKVALPAPRRRGLHPAAGGRPRAGVRRPVRQRGRGPRRRQAAACATARENGARYLGDEISQGDWAARHDRYATPLHGRTKAGQVVPMSWHCEDAAINWTELPAVTPRVARHRRRPAPPQRRVRRLGHVRLHQRAHGRGLPDRDRRRHLGAGARRRELGDVGAGQARDRARWRSPTAARSAPATARAARARSTSCPTSWAAATT